jgi:hypothetical protein
MRTVKLNVHLRTVRGDLLKFGAWGVFDQEKFIGNFNMFGAPHFHSVSSIKLGYLVNRSTDQSDFWQQCRST